MELLTKLERTVLGWLKAIPHLPVNARKWLGENAWWISVVFAVLTGAGALGLLFALFGHLSALASPYAAYFVSSSIVVWAIVTTISSLVFIVPACLLFAFAVTPLKERQKKGWVLLFAAWLLGVVSVAVNAVLTLNPLTFVTNLIFGALWLAVTGYFLFEMHSQFAHTERSKGVKAKKTNP